MKILLAILVFLVTLISGKETHSNTEKIEISVDELESMLLAFLHGIHIDVISNSTLPCKRSVDRFLYVGSEAVENLLNEKTFVGILNLTDALAATSPIARNCTSSVNQILDSFYNYVYSFDNFTHWFNQINHNVQSSMTQITLLSLNLANEFNKKDGNWTLMSDLVGQIAFLTFNSNSAYPGLKYTRGDPLAPAPINEQLWVTFESVYEFFTASRLVNETLFTDCQGALLNLILFNSDAYLNLMGDNFQQGVFLMLDSFTFLHPMVQHCYFSGIEIFENGTKVYQRISKDPQTILTNFRNNAFHVISGSIATYAQIYHQNLINLSRVFGRVVYQTLVQE